MAYYLSLAGVFGLAVLSAYAGHCGCVPAAIFFGMVALFGVQLLSE